MDKTNEFNRVKNELRFATAQIKIKLAQTYVLHSLITQSSVWYFRTYQIA
jgi:hypothetical protein